MSDNVQAWGDVPPLELLEQMVVAPKYEQAILQAHTKATRHVLVALKEQWSKDFMSRFLETMAVHCELMLQALEGDVT